MDERPTIPGTNDWPDTPIGRAVLALNAVKTMDGSVGEDLGLEDAARAYVRLALTAAGESGLEPEDVLTHSLMASENMVHGEAERSLTRPFNVPGLAQSAWLDGFLHGVATARRLWGDEETGVVELRPEESDDAR